MEISFISGLMYKIFMARRFLILLLLGSYIPVCFSQISDNDNRLREIISRYGQATVTVPYSDIKSADILTRNVSILTVRNKMFYISISPLTVEWFVRQKFNYSILETAPVKGVISASDVAQALEWDTYPSYSQYDSIMQNFKDIYPSLCRVDTIGTSVNGKLVLALKISDNAAMDEDEPEVFYTSTIHGNETGGFILMLHLADYLLKNYNTDDRVKNLVDNLEIWINPLSNPDGTYGTGNIISSPTRYNANGYDLNRNFPDPLTPNTVKQKETLDMIKFMRERRFVLSANFHSGEEVVNYPWDRWLTILHADDSWFHSISRAYADTVHSYSEPGYMSFLEDGVTRGAVWYIVYGGRQDFVTYGLQGREVTIEVDNQYITPAQQLSLLWQKNWHSLLGYLENALYGIHGQVQDAVTVVPVPAKIFIKGHDKDSSQVYSDTITGSFVRFLSPGIWNLTFSATGYRDTTVSDIAVYPYQSTDLVVNMVPLSIQDDTTKNDKAILYPNPVLSELKVILPERIIGTINVRIIDQAGRIILDYGTEYMPGIPLPINVKGLSAGVYTIVFTSKGTRVSYRGRFIVIK